MAERVSILAGRTMENLNSSLVARPVSSLDRSLSLPVSARNFFALRSKITGAEVSLMRMRDMMKKADAWSYQQRFTLVGS